MIAVPLDVEGLSAGYEPADGTWRILLGAHEFMVREWSWGERHRLVAASARDGRLDRGGFLEGLVALLVTPAPPHELTALFAWCALNLMGVRQQGRPLPLAEAERRLAERFGWRPGELSDERAGDIDRLLSRLSDQRDSYRTPPGQGWTTLQFDDAGAGS